MKKEYSAGVVLYYNDIMQGEHMRTYLLLHYPKGHWDFPKGKLEGSETNIQAAMRELKEETGLTAEIIPGFEQSLSYIFKNHFGELVHKTVTFFVGKSQAKDVTLSHEHLSYEWLPFKQALKQLTYANAQQVLSMADQFLVSLEHDHKNS